MMIMAIIMLHVEMGYVLKVAELNLKFEIPSCVNFIHMHLMCFITVGSGGYDVPSLLFALSSHINTKVKG